MNRDWDWLTRVVAQDHLSEIIHPWVEIGQTQRSARYRHWDKGRGAVSQQNFFRSFVPQFGPKIRGRLPPLDPPLQPSSKQDQTDQVTDHKLWYVQSTVNKDQSYGAKCSDLFLSVINIYNVSSLNYLGLAKRLQVAQRSLTPLFSCSSKVRSVNSSRLEFVSFKFSPSGAMSLAK